MRMLNCLLCRGTRLAEVSTTMVLHALSVPAHIFGISITTQGMFQIPVLISYDSQLFHPVFSRKSRVGKWRSQLISFPTSSMTSSLLTHLRKKRNGMLRTDYSVHLYVCGYVAWFFFVIPTSFRNIKAYKCVFMDNRFWSPSEKKKKSPVGKC
jgi:hypothetical protein